MTTLSTSLVRTGSQVQSLSAALLKSLESAILAPGKTDGGGQKRSTKEEQTLSRLRPIVCAREIMAMRKSVTMRTAERLAERARRFSASPGSEKAAFDRVGVSRIALFPKPGKN
jgi:hypothetical protein